MKREAEIRELLISNAIHLIAEGGFERATTKELTYCGGHLSDFKMNEVYIYRFFGSKERLYEAAFRRLDRELFYAFRDEVRAVGGFEQDTRKKLYEFFLKAWHFVLGNEEKCRCYVRYYYSIYFKGASLETHKKLFAEVIEEMSPFFKDEADVAAILHSVFTAMFDFAIRVHNGELEDSEINRPHIFNVLYCMMMTYFKGSEKAS
ncbi:MAG: TetR/AcrR family transcriptional regulator [Clostridia bacterium]|nr:TetR/AcrR family transcriptional regulator [Clostridia bacterium]